MIKHHKCFTLMLSMQIYNFYSEKHRFLVIFSHQTEKLKRGSAETTLPHGLDESYNHLSRDRLTIRFTYRFLRHLLRYKQVHYNHNLPSYRQKPHSLPSSC